MRVFAAVAREPRQPFDIRELELSEPREDELLVRIEAVGLCHTDLVARDQVLPTGLPAVLGHEGVGIVEKIGHEVMGLKCGDRVILTFHSCGACARCKAHEPAYCVSGPFLNYAGRRHDGSKAYSDGGEAIGGNFFGQSSFSSHAIAYQTNAVPIYSDLPSELLAPLGCGVQAGAGAVLRSLSCEAGSSLLVVGGGAVGLSAVMGAKLAGCAKIILVDPLEDRRALAIALGATDVFSPMAQADLVKSVRRIVRGGVDYALDTTGMTDAMDGAMKCLRPHGTLGLLGVPRKVGTPTPGLLADVLTFGYKIKGIIGGDSDPQEFIPYLVSMMEKGLFPVERLTRIYPFDRLNEAVEDQVAGRTVKPVLVMPKGETF